MWHFFAKLGRSRYGSYIVPTVGIFIPGGYYATHTFLHTIVRETFGAQSPSGRKEEISGHLRDLITNTYEEIQALLVKPVLPLMPEFKDPKRPPIKWFASSTLEPINFGCIEFTTGVLIGLPSFYNYQKPEDLPDHLFSIKQLKLFKSPQDPDRKAEEDEKFVNDLQEVSSLPGPLRVIDRNSSEGKQYIDSMLLSDKAKKFSIAREVFLADSYRVFSKTLLITFSVVLARTGGHAFVKLLKLKDAHVSQRFLCYSSSALLACVNYSFLRYALDLHYAKVADKRAIDLNEDYKQGADEYYSKRAERYSILGIA